MIHPKYHDEMGCSRSHTYWLSIFHDAQEAHVAAQGRDDSPASPIDVLSRGDHPGYLVVAHGGRWDGTGAAARVRKQRGGRDAEAEAGAARIAEGHPTA